MLPFLEAGLPVVLPDRTGVFKTGLKITIL